MKKRLEEYGIIILGSILFSLYVSLLLVPSKIGTGGVTGLALCFHHLFNIPIGVFTIIVNLPLFFIGLRYIGRTFCFRSFFVITSSSIIIDFINSNIHIRPINDMLLAAIFAGVLSGVSMSLLFIDKASTGGFDILAKVIEKKYKFSQISKIMLAQDIAIYTCIIFVLGPRSVMYAIIMSFVRAKTIDTVQEGFSSSRQCIIICQNAEKIIQEINTQLNRSATLINATGGYSHKDKQFLFVVIQKYQLNALKHIVKDIEPEAFVSVSSVNEIMGNYSRRYSV